MAMLQPSAAEHHKFGSHCQSGCEEPSPPFFSTIPPSSPNCQTRPSPRRRSPRLPRIKTPANPSPSRPGRPAMASAALGTQVRASPPRDAGLIFSPRAALIELCVTCRLLQQPWRPSARTVSSRAPRSRYLDWMGWLRSEAKTCSHFWGACWGISWLGLRGWHCRTLVQRCQTSQFCSCTTGGQTGSSKLAILIRLEVKCMSGWPSLVAKDK